MYHGLLSTISGNLLNSNDEFEKALRLKLSTTEEAVIYFQLFLSARSQNIISEVIQVLYA